MFYHSGFLYFFPSSFRRLISEVTERISTKLGHIFTYDCYLKNLVRSLPGVYPLWAGSKKRFFWDRLRTLTKNISSTKHDINNRKETRQSTEYRDSPTWILVHKRLKTIGEFLPTPPQTFARRTSCRLTFASHFSLIIIARWRLVDAYAKNRAWLALVRLPAGRAHAGLCHASSTVLSAPHCLHGLSPGPFLLSYSFVCFCF